MPAPNSRNCVTPTNAKIMPISKLMRLTIGSALAPASSMCCSTSDFRYFARPGREATHRQRRFADERDEIDRAAPQLLRAFADLLQERRGLLRARGAFARFDREGQRDQPARAVGQAAVVER